MDAVMNDPSTIADHVIGVRHAESPLADREDGPFDGRESVEPSRPHAFDRLAERLVAVRLETWISLAVVGASMAWIFSVMHPRLVFADTTPTGGDMGAHVWAPAYLRDHLLPKGRLIGWTPDWYAGFPAFQYYMIIPSLAVVMLNVGLVAWQAALVIAALLVTVVAVFRRPSLVRWRGLTVAVTLLVTVLSIGLPYGVAFKLIVISGLVTMPLNAWAMGRLAGMAFPGPVILAVATLPFVFDRAYNIYGGNVASTMAGEFAFSMALSLSLLAIGFTIRAVDTGRGRGWAALTLALTGLCHLFPAFFALGVVLVYVALRWGATQLRTLLVVLPVGGALGAFWALPFLVKSTYLNDMGWGKVDHFKENLLTRNNLSPDLLRDSPPLEVVFAIAVVGLVLSLWRRNRLGVSLAVAALAVALAFIHRAEGRLWNGRMLPFYYLALYLLAGIAIAEAVQLVREKRWARYFTAYAFVGLVVGELTRAVVAHGGFETRVGRVLPGSHASVLGAFLVGLLAAVLWTRRSLAALVLAALSSLAWMGALVLPAPWWTPAHGAHGFVAVAGESVLRPAAYATLHALEFPAAYVLFGMVVLGLIDVAGDVGFVADRRPARGLQLLAAPVVFVLIFATFAPALRSVPGGTVGKGGYSWGLPGWRHTTRDVSYLPSWSNWNFSGYERKAASPTSGGYGEFYDLVQMVDTVGHNATYGCGRSMWEYGPRLEGYGTPMAPMLLPHYTDGCIGSMEGLYFEASSTTPYHFLNQSALSKQPSSAQRDLPYTGFDIDLGIAQLQLMGVRYYLAFSDQAVAAALAHPALTQIATADVWHMFLVADSELVAPLRYEPVVYANVGEKQNEWLQPAAKFFTDPTQFDVLRAATGPAGWARFTIPETAKLTAGAFKKATAAAKADGGVVIDPTVPAAPRLELPPVRVSGIASGDDTIEFDVDQIGVPVLVKASYFPNWKVSGAKGPYRVTPNLMVVVPTATHVRLHYGYTGVDLVSMMLTLFGIVGLVALFRARPQPVRDPWFDPFAAIAARVSQPRRRVIGLALPEVDDLVSGEWWRPASDASSVVPLEPWIDPPTPTPTPARIAPSIAEPPERTARPTMAPEP